MPIVSSRPAARHFRQFAPERRICPPLAEQRGGHRFFARRAGAMVFHAHAASARPRPASSGAPIDTGVAKGSPPVASVATGRPRHDGHALAHGPGMLRLCLCWITEPIPAVGPRRRAPPASAGEPEPAPSPAAPGCAGCPTSLRARACSARASHSRGSHAILRP